MAGSGALGHVEAENADVRRAVPLGQVQSDLKPSQVRLERVNDRDLADRRADGAQAEASRLQERLEVGVIGFVQIQDVRAPDRAELDELDPIRLQAVDLLDRVGGNLVGEGTQADHGGVGLRH